MSNHREFGPALDPNHPLADIAGELTALFAREGFTADGIAGHLGPEFTEALHRGEPAPVALGARGDSTLDKLIRLFILHEPVPATELSDAVGPRLASALIDSGAAVVDDLGTVYIALDIRPHVIVGTNRWVFSDVDASLIDHIPGPEHVLGVGAASLSLLRATPNTPVDTVLDIGTGSGIQILGQLGNARQVTATDIHPRALDLARATVAATDDAQRVEFLHGPWFEPVAGRRFDRIVANPPFVVGPPEIHHVYRDSGLNLDGASELMVSSAANYLNPGGSAHLLAAWVHDDNSSWQTRVASWVPDKGVNAWIIQRDVADPALYVSTWLKDESIDPRSAQGREKARLWIEHFRDHGVTGIGFGFVALERIADDADSEVLAEYLPQAFDGALGSEVTEHFARTAWLRRRDADDIAATRFGLREGVAREDIALADASSPGFSREVMRLTRTDGPRWSHEIDETLASIVAGLHPDGLDLGEVIALYAAAHGLDEAGEAELRQAVIPAIVDLIRHGFLIAAK